MEEWLKDIRHQLRERTSSPLLGSFLISWCIWNYKFLVILLSEAPVSITFELIQKVSFPSPWHIFGLGVLAPLITSLAYIYLYPIPAKKVYEFSLRKQKEILEIRQKIEDQTPLTVERSREIRQNMSRQMEEHYQEIERKDIEISKLKAAISDLSAQLESNKNKEVKSKNTERKVKESLTGQELSNLERVAQEGGSISNTSLSHLASKDRLQLEFALGELAKKGLVSINNAGYKLTHEGKGILVNAREVSA